MTGRMRGCHSSLPATSGDAQVSGRELSENHAIRPTWNEWPGRPRFRAGRSRSSGANRSLGSWWYLRRRSRRGSRTLARTSSASSGAGAASVCSWTTSRRRPAPESGAAAINSAASRRRRSVAGPFKSPGRSGCATGRGMRRVRMQSPRTWRIRPRIRLRCSRARSWRPFSARPSTSCRRRCESACSCSARAGRCARSRSCCDFA